MALKVLYEYGLWYIRFKPNFGICIPWGHSWLVKLSAQRGLEWFKKHKRGWMLHSRKYSKTLEEK